MKTTLISSRGELLTLEREWNALLRSSAADSIFLTWEWITSWLASRSDHVSLFVISVRDDQNRLVGIAPFYRRGFSFLKVIRVEGLSILGDTESGAEYPGIIIARGHEDAVQKCLQCEIRARKAEWDLIWMPKMAAWSESYSLAQTLFSSEGFAVNSRPRAFSAIRLPDTFEEFLDAQSRQRRHRIRKYIGSLSQAKGVTIRLVTSESQRESAVQSLISLHTKRWSLKKKPGSFLKSRELVKFYLTFTRVALQKRWLRLYQLFIGNQLVATQIGYVYGSVFYQLQEAFDQTAQSGSGNLLRAHVISECIVSGLEEYDFLGGYTEHKRRWCANERSGADLLVACNSIVGKAIVKLGIWPTGKYLRPSKNY